VKSQGITVQSILTFDLVTGVSIRGDKNTAVNVENAGADAVNGRIRVFKLEYDNKGIDRKGALE